MPWTLVWLALLFLTLRPFGPVDAAVDIATAPLRVVSELASPLLFVRQNRVRAAESRLAQTAANEEASNKQLLADLAEAARPDEPRLFEGRRIVHAQVLGHRDFDHLRVRLRDARGVELGYPVACGNAYAGRIVDFEGPGALDAGASDVAIVQLVTAKDFHVGAIVEEPERVQRAPIDPAFGTRTDTSAVLMTVGGVVRKKRRLAASAEIRLAVHNPSDRTLASGLVRVHELFPEDERGGGLSAGLHLGRVHKDDDGFWITPELDYKDGLFQVVVLCPPDAAYGSAVPFDTALRDSNWVRTRPLSLGDANPARSACKIRVGTRHGVYTGAAVTSVGAHLVGRVVRSGPASADVAFLDDPGFSVVAVARIDGDDEPRVLGRLVAMGRGEDPEGDTLRFRWIVRVPLDLALADGSRTRHARLFTGSGDPGLPAGFSFGETELPIDAEAYTEPVLEVRTDIAPEDVQALFVRTQGAQGADA